jgi:hypothetical protein
MPFGPLICELCHRNYMVSGRGRIAISRFCSRLCRARGIGTPEVNAKKVHRGTQHPRYVPPGTRRVWAGQRGQPWVTIKTDQGWVLEHRLVAQPDPGQIVHHVNGDPTDNRPENLEVMTQAEHAKRHDPERTRDHKGRYV